MEFKEKLIKELNKLPGVQLLRDDFCDYRKVELVGGAIVTAMNNIGIGFNVMQSSPKDYDFYFNVSTQEFINKGYTFVCETDNARTFTKNGYTFQALKTGVNGIDFTISQIKFDIKRDDIVGDLFALENKILIPTPQSDINLKFNQLYRIPHYEAKGFTIHPSTYKSLVESTHKLAGGRDYLKCES